MVMAVSKRIKADQTGRLFSDSPPFKIVPLGPDAARRKTDHLKVLQSMLLDNEEMYPSIGQWYTEKVVPGLRTCQRMAYLAFENEQPVAAAILKLGEHAKFCHVRIAEGFRDLSLGQMIFTQMAFHARHAKDVKDIHFTLPESLWNSKAEFFRSFGFDEATRAPRQYRNGEEELFCSAPIDTVWAHARERLHLLDRFSPGGYSNADKILLSMGPSYGERIFKGIKQVEIRRKFSRRWKGRQVVVYGIQPLGALMGEVTISEVTSGSPSDIWERYGEKTGCSHEEFSSYVGDSTEIYALELSDANPYIAPVDISQISHLIDEELRPPQSFLEVKMNSADPWGKAISVVGLLHSMFPSRRSVP
jgi:predicted transcriptional regulator